MSKVSIDFDPRVIEAEENLLIDCQFLIQDLMNKSGISRSALAKRVGISEARLSQLMSSKANPTAKTLARIFHALGAKPSISIGGPMALAELPPQSPEWQWEFTDDRAERRSRRNAQMVAVAKEIAFSNDNGSSQIIVWEEGRRAVMLRVA